MGSGYHRAARPRAEFPADAFRRSGQPAARRARGLARAGPGGPAGAAGETRGGDAGAGRGHHRGRRTRRRGVAAGRAGDRLRDEGADRGRHADRRDGGTVRLRRPRVLHRRPDVQPQQPRDPVAARPPRQRRPGRAHPGGARHLPGPAHVGRLRRHRVGRAARPLPRHRHRGDLRPHLRPGLGCRGPSGRRRLDRRDLDPVRAAALQPRERPHLGAEHPAFPPDPERAGHLGADSADRPRVVVVVRRSARHRRRAVEPPARDLALRRRGLDALSRAPAPGTRSPTAPT